MSGFAARWDFFKPATMRRSEGFRYILIEKWS
jgi:hypothetical protein